MAPLGRTMTSGVAVVVVGLAALAAAAPLHKAPVDEAAAKPKLAAPSLRFSVDGWTVLVPDQLEVFYDAAVFDPQTLTVNVRDGDGNAANCTSALTRYVEYVAVPWKQCAAPIFDAATGEYQVTAQITPRAGGAPQTFTAERGVRERWSESADITAFTFERRPWPFENDNRGWPPTEPNLIGNIMENYQSFSGANSAYWHQGFDIRSERLQECHSPIDGVVVNLVRYSNSDLYWSMMVEDDLGFIWQFHHLDVDSFNFGIGDSVRVGDVLGLVAVWTASHNGALYHHTHMNVVRPFPGWNTIPEPYVDGWQYFNPHYFLQPGNYTNAQKPVTDGVLYFLEDGTNTAFAASSEPTPPLLSGAIDIVLQVESEYTPTNSLPGQPYPNGVYEIGYSVKRVGSNDYAVPPLALIRMDKLPNEWSYTLPDLGAADVDFLLRYVYRQQFTYGGTAYTSVFDYNTRRLYYTVTNAVRGEPDTLGAWNTAERLADGTARFPNGNYVVSVYAIDYYGGRFDVEATVEVRN